MIGAFASGCSSLRMAKAALLSSSPGAGAPKKGPSRRAKGSVCTLLDLCPEDKAKVAKLIHQVVDLGKELTQCKAKAAQDLQERTQHLRQRSTAVAQENQMLKAKLTHAFTLLRTYQHKVQALEAAQPAAALHGAPSGAADEPQHRPGVNSSLQYRRELAEIQPESSKPNVAAAQNSSEGSMQCHTHQNQTSLSPPRSRGGRHKRHQENSTQPVGSVSMCREQHGALQQHTEPPQRHTRNGQGQNVRAQHNTAGAAFADLAAQTLAWQQDDGAASQSPSNPDASQVLRFDPTLGPDGGFYFVSWDSRQNGADQSHGGQAAEPALQVEHRQQLQWEQQHSQAAMPVYADRQQSELQLHQAKPIPATGDTDTLHAATATASQIAQAPAQMDMRCSPGDAAEASLSQCQAASDPEEGQEGRTSAAAPSAVLTASLAGPAAPLTGGTAAVPFPIQGGGEAGVLLRAAAAAAVGCSHELVMAAAGRCDTEQARAMPDCIAALPQSAASTPMLSQQAEPSSAQLPVPSHSAIHHAQPAAVPAQPAAMPPQSTAHHAQPAAVPAQPAAPPAHSVAPSAQYVICSAQPVAPSVQLVASSAPSTAPPAQHVTSGPSPQGGPLVAPAMKGPHQLVQPHMSAAVLQHEGMPEIALSGNTAAVAQEQNLRCPHLLTFSGQEEVGFDSSLMDLVAEVEQMVACNVHASGQGSAHSSKSFTSSPVSVARSLACRQQASIQQPARLVASSGKQAGAYENLFEENDVVSMISDQEYGAYQQY